MVEKEGEIAEYQDYPELIDWGSCPQRGQIIKKKLEGS